MDAENSKIFNDWRVAVVSLRGTHHKNADMPCQDSSYWRIPIPGILVAAVTDGAGSARLAEVGANIASRVAVEHACQQLLNARDYTVNTITRFLTESVTAARSALELEARSRNTNIGELACTLILLIASRTILAVAQIGDGAVVLRKIDGSMATLTLPVRGEYFNETVFLTSRNALDLINLKVSDFPITHIASFTDGIEMLALTMPDSLPYLPFFTPLFSMLSEAPTIDEANSRLRSLFLSSGIHGKTNDDITLLMATLT